MRLRSRAGLFPAQRRARCMGRCNSSFRLASLFLVLSLIIPAASSDEGSWFSWSSGGGGGGWGGGGAGMPLAVDGASCSNGLSMGQYEVTCGDGSSSYCTLDETVSIEASIQLDDDLSSSYASLSVEACVGVCETLMDRRSVDLCGGALTPTGGQTCPEAGSYDLYVPDFRLPSCGNDCNGDWEDGYAAGAMYFLYVTLADEDGAAIGNCDVVLVTPPDEGWTNAYGSVAIAALVGATLVALAAYLGCGGRRRLVACSCNETDDDSLNNESGVEGAWRSYNQKPPSSNFEMM